MTLEPGRDAQLSLTVTEADTAIALGSGDVPVLGTPRVVALAEAATVAALADALEAGSTTVGTRISLDHVVASAVGQTVIADARLSVVDGRRLTFAVTVHDGTQLVARGTVERLIVDRQRFLDRLSGTH